VSVVEEFDWSGYLRLAEDLSSKADPASLRSAVSRTYYFVYHLALKRAEANGFKAIRGEGIHAQLWRLFDASPEPACKRLGRIAGRLKGKRQQADYEGYFPRLEAEVPGVIADAREFTARLAELALRHPNPGSVRF
jgi:uncharacterized protein (UPF0332 family)